MNYLHLPITLLFIIYSFQCTEARKCYKCSYNSGDTDKRCIENPVTLPSPTVSCNKKYCTIVRVETKDPSGRVQSFLRGCEEVPDFINKDVDGGDTKTYYRACTKELCNNGTGTESFFNGGYEQGPALVLLVPGTRSSAINLNASIVGIIFTIYIMMKNVLI